jgi:predicted methyltransferase
VSEGSPGAVYICFFVFTLSFLPGTDLSAEGDTIYDDLVAVMEMDHRSEADRTRDDNRSPELALDFFGLQPDMKVIEFAPGNGWYSRIIAPSLKRQGEFYVIYPEEWFEGFDEFLRLDVMRAAKKWPVEMGWNDEDHRYTFADELDFGIDGADMVLFIREYHNLNGLDKARFNQAAFDALKPGGTYVVVDHSRRPTAPATSELRRREDPPKVILEVQSAGSELQRSSDMFYRS